MSGRPVKRPRSDHSVVSVWEREVGLLPNRHFCNRFSASEDLLRRLSLDKRLKKHKGCVNTVSFNADGDILLSGSDDKQVILWDWQTATVKLSFDSGHLHHIFHAKFMPFSDDRSIVTCAADFQVRHSKILESGQVETCLLDRHQGPVKKLAVEPGSPFSFYTCGDDGVVKHFDLRTRVATNLFTCKDAKTNIEAYLHAIAFDPRNPDLFAVAGMDEYARLYDIRSYRSPVDHFCPGHLIGNDHVGITGLAFSDQSELLASYTDEFIYLFIPDMGLGPALAPPYPSSTKTEERRTPQVYKEHKNRETVKGVTFFGPKCEYVVSGSDCGRIFIWRKKDGELLRAMEADKHVVKCIESHPHMPLMCSSGIDTDVKIWTPGGTEKPMSPPQRGDDHAFNLLGYNVEDYAFNLLGYNVEDYAFNLLGYNVEDDDSDDEPSDESSDDDDSAEEEENGEVDVEITNDYDDDDDDDDDSNGDWDGGKD